MTRLIIVKAFVAYVLAFFMGPTVGALAALIVVLLLSWLVPNPQGDDVRSRKRILAYAFTSALSCVLAGFVTVWCARLIFGWLHVRAGFVLVVMLGLGFFLNDYREVSHPSESMMPVHVARMIGDFVGVAIGALYLLR